MANNEEWLKTLKPGDKVYYTYRNSVGIRTVERITPTGRIILKGNSGQFINGSHRLDNWNTESISELTDELRTDFHNRVKVRKIKEYDWNDASPGIINMIYDMIYGKEAQQ